IKCNNLKRDSESFTDCLESQHQGNGIIEFKLRVNEGLKCLKSALPKETGRYLLSGLPSKPCTAAEQIVGKIVASENLGLRPPGGAMSPAEAATQFLKTLDNGKDHQSLSAAVAFTFSDGKFAKWNPNSTAEDFKEIGKGMREHNGCSVRRTQEIILSPNTSEP
ncbi:hypothetical protein HispidOSU_024229, partial [Sigmodon hispidus]